ncbi:LuxR C-terminal-related transcriptional regulator [Polaribacter sp. ALD11]|uniref:LuxR C-terminal-related transcriptional regulator n=1 Tax=Polaribacter sp. ALD11 TaxID=2058137 RepID=UPI0012FD0696|nr:LuxR C-terminal-related transcriptional regulator [Polaribacter sp. ALD11]
MSFSQTRITYFHDLKKEVSISNIETIQLKSYERLINKGLDNGIFWFKIEKFKDKDESFIVQILNDQIRNTQAYQNKKELDILKGERYSSYAVTFKNPIFLKVDTSREALIPINVISHSTFFKAEKKDLLFIGFYNGCAFIVILINIFYFINFKDDIFIYYSLFLLSVTSSLFISDGMLYFFNFSKNVINNLYVIIHFFVFIFSFLFSKNYLQAGSYFSKVNYVGWFILVLVAIFFCLYIVTDIFLFFVIMELLGFSLLLFCWFLGVLLFRKNIYTKIFVIGYFFILMLSINFFILKLFGFSSFYISAKVLKLGGFFEMILLSFAVVYRMRILKNENLLMTSEIIAYSKEVVLLSEALKKTNKTEKHHLKEANLSFRELEIFNFIIGGITNKEIAVKLNISVNTVKFHVKNIYEKLNIKSRKEALAI